MDSTPDGISNPPVIVIIFHKLNLVIKIMIIILMSYFQLLIFSLTGNWWNFYDINENMSNWKNYTFHNIKTFFLTLIWQSGWWFGTFGLFSTNQ